MEEYKDISRGLKMLLGKAEEMGGTGKPTLSRTTEEPMLKSGSRHLQVKISQ